MTVVKSPLSDSDREVTGNALQSALVDLLDLSLLAKQAHWNLIGPRFRSIHLQLDEVVTTARTYSDTVAERAAAIGVNPDGRAATVAKTSGLPDFPSGWVRDTDVVEALVEAFAAAIGRMRERIEATEKPDPVTQDLFIGLTAEMEKQYWMFQAENQS
ncbi:DNA starvation/stationary phase protection protein [Streptacidiphilus sp. ASG 303]|uniref:Dps family protein n=1 Tax=Streptacidiphilus sp. ASG 303 TaxID=2896847 RepID=UPI001E3F9F16|nr:DNA starvation/stationary phase protection protein [Streptacidiphilus sp. ASG 303]MCD0484700.1 DNA starvation/stationary phase protection protein [Streptacidiphilus sp. ASG 303]